MNTLRKALSLLDQKQRWHMAGLLIIFLITALVQLAGVGSIMPFLSLLTNPNLVQESEFLSFIYELFKFDNIVSFLFFIGFVVLGLFIFTNVMIAITLWATTKFAWSTQARIAIFLFKSYLLQPYEVFLNRNTSDIGKNILTETHQLVAGILVPILRMIAYGMVAFFTALFLVLFDTFLATICILITAGGYGCYFLLVQQKLHKKGQERLIATTNRYKIAAEAFGGIKETKVSGKELAFVEQFIPPSIEYSRAMTAQQIIKDLPRYIFETLAFGSLLSVILFLIASGANMQNIVPIAGMYAFAGYRLLPAINDIYRNLSAIRFNIPVLETIRDEINNKERQKAIIEKNKNNEIVNNLSFERSLELKNICFKYPNTEELAVKDASFIIEKGSFVAIVGQTGSGKTTLVDIILGLFKPLDGDVMADGIPINKSNIKEWQKMIGYVPQDIFLTDDTVAANIAFGISDEERNIDFIINAARIANIHDFIINELPEGYDTIVGERGIRISGGQRQRIGIARALYHDPEIVVLDEATSNLDQTTEASFYKAIKQTAESKTVIMIAHRLQRVKSCDMLLVIDNGEIIGRGNYDELIKNNKKFIEMVKA